MNVNKEKFDLSRRGYAITAGSALIVMAIAAAGAYGYAHGQLVIPDDGEATLRNLLAKQGLWKAELLGWFIILISDIVCTWALYMYLKPIHNGLSLLGAWLRLCYTMMLAMALSKLLDLSVLTRRASAELIHWSTADLAEVAMQSLSGFDMMWSLGLIIFGGHLLIIGIVSWQAKYIPKMISLLLIIAAVGYVLLHTAEVFLEQYEATIATLEMLFILPMAIGELGFGVWLLLRGGKQH